MEKYNNKVLSIIIFLLVIIEGNSCSTRQNNQKYFLVESESMIPAIYPGDYVQEDSNIINLRYGDIVGFKYQNENGEFVESDVSRVIGLPGDSIGIIDNIFYINGNICKNRYIGEANYHIYSFHEYEEYFKDGLIIRIMKGIYNRHGDNISIIYVPEEHYYLLGDSRSLAIDSRFYGPIPKDNITGKIVKIESKN